MKPNDDDPDRVGDWVNISKEQWLLCALLSGIVFVLMGLLGTVWILGIADFGLAIDDLGVRARAAGPIGAFLLAIVTFFTIGWRGKVQEDQAVEQRRANDSTDENNLATLLQKGAELIVNDEKRVEVAGVACLEAVVTAANQRFAAQGMALLAGHLAKKYSAKQNSYVPAAIRQALELGFLHGNTTRGTVTLKGESAATKWYGVSGVAHVTFEDAIFGGDLSDIYRCNTKCKFRRVTFRSEVIQNGGAVYRNCRFEGCSITGFDLAAIGYNEFLDCDFSNCQFTYSEDERPDLLPLQGRGNYYWRDKAPVILFNSLEIDWETKLEVVDADDIFND